MNKAQRIREVIIGIVTIAVAAIMAFQGDRGYTLVVSALSLTLTVAGVRWLYYYLTMARHMVDGHWSLYTGAFLFDLGFFTSNLTTVPKIYVMMYLLGGHLFAGLVSLLRARESMSIGSPGWKTEMLQGGVNVAIALLGAFFFRSMRTVTIIYCIGLAYSAIIRIVTAFRDTAIVYIP